MRVFDDALVDFCLTTHRHHAAQLMANDALEYKHILHMVYAYLTSFMRMESVCFHFDACPMDLINSAGFYIGLYDMFDVFGEQRNIAMYLLLLQYDKVIK